MPDCRIRSARRCRNFRAQTGCASRRCECRSERIGIIYEARPNVTVDAVGLCFKAGNAVLLRGGSAAINTNKRIVEILDEVLASLELPAGAIQLIEDSDRASVDEMLKLKGYIDVLIPRGGASLIQNVLRNSSVPVIETGTGICHIYIDNSAEPSMARSHRPQRQGTAAIRMQFNGDSSYT